MVNTNFLLITIIFIQLTFLSQGQTLQHEVYRFCNLLNVNCNLTSWTPMDNSYHSYQSLQNLTAWFNYWKGSLSLTPEQIEDLRQKLQALELKHKINLNLNGKTPKLCKYGNAKCRKPTQLDKRITGAAGSGPGESNSVNEDGNEDLPPAPDLSRQELIATAASGFTLFSILPFVIANLAMSSVSLSLGIFSLAGGTRLAELHQEQLNALSGIAGVPIELVTPESEQGEVGDGGGDPGRIGLSLLDPNTQSFQLVRKSLQDVQQFFHEMRSKSLLENSLIIIPLVLFWTGLAVFLSLFGYYGIPILLMTFIAPVIYLAGVRKFDSDRFAKYPVSVSPDFRRRRLKHLEQNIRFADIIFKRAIGN